MRILDSRYVLAGMTITLSDVPSYPSSSVSWEREAINPATFRIYGRVRKVTISWIPATSARE